MNCDSCAWFIHLGDIKACTHQSLLRYTKYPFYRLHEDYDYKKEIPKICPKKEIKDE